MTKPAQTENTTLRRAGTFVDKRVGGLQARFLAERRDPSAVAALARLRRGLGKPPGELLDILEFTVGDELSAGALQDDPTPEEVAAHIAITLYALHQQSQGERMHRRGHGLGTALRALHSGEPNSIPEPITRRFRMLGTADSLTELTHHLRGVVQLLKAGGVPLDYGRLADELVDFAHRDRRDGLRLRWGRQFYRFLRRDDADQPATA